MVDEWTRRWTQTTAFSSGRHWHACASVETCCGDWRKTILVVISNFYFVLFFNSIFFIFKFYYFTLSFLNFTLTTSFFFFFVIHSSFSHLFSFFVFICPHIFCTFCFSLVFWFQSWLQFFLYFIEFNAWQFHLFFLLFCCSI